MKVCVVPAWKSLTPTTNPGTPAPNTSRLAATFAKRPAAR